MGSSYRYAANLEAQVHLDEAKLQDMKNKKERLKFERQHNAKQEEKKLKSIACELKQSQRKRNRTMKITPYTSLYHFVR
ncbi:unnamed protein product [Didymodactylos carnosus]|uniref:Uncharacterized protein n=1 Tax=Didymodactylos carnosus TaxID=1234261 RepID=A0A814K1Y4_9BILA|nr:unnamed protein product [Didymodactylos carnosus]CAF1099548.1 unnamed protein product [Didymodactylos carnosus]CAF3813467.1 unnamed protein product [Didymodactylos carnosus]CAF3860965.1 unnamed protein product [Didymodactylos carnosus]